MITKVGMMPVQPVFEQSSHSSDKTIVVLETFTSVNSIPNPHTFQPKNTKGVDVKFSGWIFVPYIIRGSTITRGPSKRGVENNNGVSGNPLLRSSITSLHSALLWAIESTNPEEVGLYKITTNEINSIHAVKGDIVVGNHGLSIMISEIRDLLRQLKTEISLETNTLATKSNIVQDDIQMYIYGECDHDIKLGISNSKWVTGTTNNTKHKHKSKIELSKSSSTTSRSLHKVSHAYKKTVLPFFVRNVTQSEELFKQFYAKWKTINRFSWHIHTTNKTIRKLKENSNHSHLDIEYSFPTFCTVRSLAICWDSSSVFVIGLWSKKKSKRLEMTKRWGMVKEVMENPLSEKINHGMKFQLQLFMDHGIYVENNVMDSKVGIWMTNSDIYKDVEIGALIDEFCPQVKYPTSQDGFINSIIQSHQSFLVMPKIEEELLRCFQMDLFLSMEMKILPILAKMEYAGIMFDDSAFTYMKNFITESLKRLEKDAFSSVGKTFDLASTVELASILYDHLKLPYKGKNSKSGNRSTKAQILSSLSSLHPLPDIVLKHRKLRHTMSTYIDVLPKQCIRHVHRDNSNRIHPIYNQTIVPTGRIACENPNLQSIMHSVVFPGLSNESVNTLENKYFELNIRNAFIAGEGCILISADYCQLEFRLMAHFSNDTNALRFSHDKDSDIFRSLASVWKSKDYEHVTIDERSQAKSLCYGILYGMGNRALSEALKLPLFEAKKLKESFQSKFVGLTQFSREVEEFRKKHNYVHTIEGRRRYLKDFTPDNDYKKADRLAVNSVCQGSAADIAKIAMIQIDNYLKSHNLSARLILNLHDELLYEVPIEEKEHVGKVVKEIMETCIQLAVPLTVKMSIGQKWGSMSVWDVPREQ